MERIYDHQRIREYLERHGLSALFDAEHVPHFKLYRMEKGEVLCSEGERLEELKILVKGRVKVTKTLPNGSSLLLRFNDALSIMGEVELVTKKPAANTVTAAVECYVIGISFSLLYENYYDNPRFLQYINQYLGHRLYTSSNAAILNALTRVENRFASYLLATHPDQEGTNSEEFRTENLVETAALLGTSYRHLNRIINEFVSKQLVEKKNGRIVITDLEKLEELADGIKYE
ncbi:transcriptional regulator [Bacillus salacetis]|uniref:Transcriptional regulator n=1 Tax=Bacillus salacetis TaxID=2315464 RepID=A0A3A1QWQ7_9BACI|nr:cyclic nucleotide-binding domain-containing protein [Bacillus salacetis]RIW31330.1 transcriptional regulator [Bacillus salacetis]